MRNDYPNWFYKAMKELEHDRDHGLITDTVFKIEVLNLWEDLDQWESNSDGWNN